MIDTFVLFIMAKLFFPNVEVSWWWSLLFIWFDVGTLGAIDKRIDKLKGKL